FSRLALCSDVGPRSMHPFPTRRSSDLPSSVLDLVRARVADLDEADKTLLDAAACCGFEFDPWVAAQAVGLAKVPALQRLARIERDRKSTRLNSSHEWISYAVFCLKKKK